MIKIVCPNCASRYTTDDQALGRIFQCRKCNTSITVGAAVREERVTERPASHGATPTSLRSPAPPSQSAGTTAGPAEPGAQELGAQELGAQEPGGQGRKRLWVGLAAGIGVAALAGVAALIFMRKDPGTGPAAGATEQKYAGIEISSTTVNAVVVEFLADPDGPANGGDFRPIWQRYDVTNLAQGLKESGALAKDRLADTVKAVGRFHKMIQDEFAMPPENIVVVAGSGITKEISARAALAASNKRQLEDAIFRASRLPVTYLAEDLEVEGNIRILAPARLLDDTLLIDMGNRGVRGGGFHSALGRCTLLEPLIGVGSLRDQVHASLKKKEERPAPEPKPEPKKKGKVPVKANPVKAKKVEDAAAAVPANVTPGESFAAEARRMAQTLIRGPLQRDLEQKPALMKRKQVQIIGGIPWVVATFQNPGGRGDANTVLAKNDIANFLDAFHTRHALPPFVPPADLATERRDWLLREVADIKDFKFKDADTVCAGLEILKILSEELRFADRERVSFNNFGIYGALLTQVKERRLGGAQAKKKFHDDQAALQARLDSGPPAANPAAPANVVVAAAKEAAPANQKEKTPATTIEAKAVTLPADPEAGLFTFMKDRTARTKASGQRVYEELLKSCVFVVNDSGTGSGVLLDAKNRLIVTNHHVVHEERFQAAAAGPITRTGRLDQFSVRDPMLGTACQIFTLPLLQGDKCSIDMIRTNGGLDPFLRIEDSNRKALAQNDDGAGFPNARIIFTAPRDDNYRIIAAAYDSAPGNFLLRIVPMTGRSPGKAPAGAGGTVRVAFPAQQANGVATDKKTYLASMLAAPDKHRGRVLLSDETRDLAIVQLDQLPPGAKAVSLARESAKPGQNVHSIGNPGASAALWVYTSGTVRTSPFRKQFLSFGGGTTMKHDFLAFETQSPINPGDSGGPVVNDAGELVALTQSISTKGSLVSTFIDVSEIKETVKKSGYAWTEGAASAGRAQAELSNAEVSRLVELLSHASPRVRGQAAMHLADAGAHARFAVPGLTKLLSDSDPDVRRSGAFALSEIGVEAIPGLRQALRDESTGVRLTALNALAAMGGAAQSVMPEIVAAVADGDRDVASSALQAGFKIDALDLTLAAEAAKRLEQGEAGLRGPARAVLQKALAHLALQPQDAAKSLDVLRLLYRSSEEDLKTSATAVLRHMGPAARPAKDDFVKSLDAAAPGDRIEAMHLLASCCSGPEKKELIVPLLVKMMAETDKNVRLEALKAVENLGEDAQGAFQVTFDAYAKERDKALRLQALRSLAALGTHAKGAVPRLVTDVKQFKVTYSDPELYKGVLRTLGNLGVPAAKELLKLVSDPNLGVRLRAVEALGVMGPEGRDYALAPLQTYFAEVETNPAVLEAMRKALDQMRQAP